MISEKIKRPFKVGDVVRIDDLMIGIIIKEEKYSHFRFAVFALSTSLYYYFGEINRFSSSALSHNLCAKSVRKTDSVE